MQTLQDIHLNICSPGWDEPLMRIVAALTELEPPMRLVVHPACESSSLYRVLDRLHFCHSLARCADRSYDLQIWHAI